MEKDEYLQKLKEDISPKLREVLGRQPSVNEEVNANNDPVLMMRVLIDEIHSLGRRVDDLENL